MYLSNMYPCECKDTCRTCLLNQQLKMTSREVLHPSRSAFSYHSALLSMFPVLYFMGMIASCIAQRQNFLLIIVDDLRTSVGRYGDEKAYTPNIDQLAGEAAIFSQAFAQQALCAPSRNSFLTSRRPDTLQLYDFYSYWRTDVGNFTTLPQHLKNNGYITKSIGKVFHPGISSNYSDDSPYSWTEVPFHPFTERFKDAPVCQANVRTLPAQNLVCPVNILSMPNKTLPDIEILEEAKSFIRDHERDSDPFFLAVGFQKPHIPFKYPEKYLKYHLLHKFEVPSPYKWPENVSSVAYNPWIDLRRREDIESLNLKFPWEKIPKSFGRLIIQSYYAAVTYIDDLIGELISQLKLSSIRQNTTIILMSDHGWSLGENAVWAKYSNFDVALRVPLIISIPGLTFKKPKDLNTGSEKFEANAERRLLKRMRIRIDKLIQYEIALRKFKGYRAIRRNIYTLKKQYLTGFRARSSSRKSDSGIIIDSLVELVDIFPTVADLAKISIPICPNRETKNGTQIEQVFPQIETVCSEGTSLMPLVRAALKGNSIPWKKAAFGQYPRPSIKPSMHPNSDEPRLKEIKAMGYTLRTNRYRYTAWLAFNPGTKAPDWDTIIAEELYDHTIDSTENRNLAGFHDYVEIKKEMKALLQRGWRGALPEKIKFPL